MSTKREGGGGGGGGGGSGALAFRRVNGDLEENKDLLSNEIVFE